MNNTVIPVITIDGPSGAGKGTVAQTLALDLGWNILDSGALYRTLAYYFDKEGLESEDLASNFEKIRKDFIVHFEAGIPGQPVKIFFQNQDITNLVRTEEVAKKTSLLAANPYVRAFIKPSQRDFMTSPGLIADGRDMGTVIFPDADLKIYLTASIEERAKRRQVQLKRLGSEVNMRVLLEELKDRDKKDIEREHSPLKPADDSIIIDTSNLDPIGVIKEIKRQPLSFLKK
ncbi:(d)CMP kinase [Gammaproteobacteria bacterium]|nr:(d)CMP kinase [Gammaproteobacteria bacterium]